MERRNYHRNESAPQDNRKTEQAAHPEYIWVSYSDEMNKKKEEDSEGSLLEKSNRFAL